jgi:ABC-2 type transport system ATP-binding protein
VAALAGATFHVGRGETIALLGPNGAGKSTAIDLMLGLQRPDAGHVEVLGESPARAVRDGRVGAMLQQSGLPSNARVGEIVDLVRRLYGRVRGLDELLAASGLGDVADRMVEKLSGGQEQRVHLALAMAGRPELLFLDEPTVGLDPEARRRFWQLVNAVATSGASVVFATHYLDEADVNADRIVVLHRGRVVAEGPPSAIKAAASARSIRLTLPAADPARLLALPGVRDVAVHGEDVTLRSTDADVTVAALFASGPVRDLTVSGAGLEDALIALTGDAPAPAA